MGFIYLITNTINNKKYVGQTSHTIEKRFREHIYKSNQRQPYPLCRALAKYGKENFSISELRQCSTQEELDYYETYFALQLKTFCPNGYNLKTGNGQNSFVSIETRKKLSLSGKRAVHKKGPRINYTYSEETRKKVSASMKKNWAKQIHRDRKSPEATKRFIESCIKSYQVTSPTGDSFIVTNLSQFCRDNNLRFDSMCKIANLKVKTSHHRGWTISHFASPVMIESRLSPQMP